MDIRNRRALKQEAAAALKAAPNQKRIIAAYTGASLALSLVVMLLDTLLANMIQHTSGLSNIGNRTILQTIQATLPLAQFILLMLWEFGYIGSVLRLSRRQATDVRDLTEGFHLFGPIARLTLLQYAISFVLCFVSVYLATMVFLFSPFARGLLDAMNSLISDPALATTDIMANAAIAEALTDATLPLLVIFLVILCLLVLPVTYLFRMASYCLLDAPRAGAIAALRESRNMMRRNRMNLLKLDLSFWWYYLLMMVPALICYGDTLLPMLGVSLPLGETASRYLFYGLYIVVQFLFSVRFQNYVEITYANAYEALRPKPQQGGVVLGNIFQM